MKIKAKCLHCGKEVTMQIANPVCRDCKIISLKVKELKPDIQEPFDAEDAWLG